jgi:asparagine synthase (glutamine-hydrolysing)
MCRILGHFAAEATPHEIRAAAVLQRHGGPDGRYRAHGPGWALASNRLAITDPDDGAQPFHLGERIKVVFNGEIYNHVELRARMRARGHRFSGHCDGNVLPALYAEYGPDFVDHLDGMFALALIDLRAEPLLLLATDHLGMKPLYYHWDQGRLHFSSEIPSLLSFRGVPVRPWGPGLDAYLRTKTPFGEQTMFDGVRVMPPAGTLIVSRRRGLTLRRREPVVPAAESPPDAESVPLVESGRRIRHLLRREVERLCHADVPVCAITSGGLDSGFVTALFARSAPGLHMFNIAYRGDWPHDEREYARDVARMWQGRYHQVEVDPATFPDMLPDVVWHLGQPNADPITLSTFALFDAVRQAGFTVALTGDGADEVFGGYDRIREALSGGADWRAGYTRALAAVPVDLRERLYTPEYRDHLRARPAGPDRLAAILADGPRALALNEVEVRHRLPAYHLRRVDHLSMAHSVEVRLPFCQRDVVAAGLALPAPHRIHRGRVKRALYAAAANDVPLSVLRRPKQPFTLPITAMLAEGRPLMTLVADLLTPARLRADGRLDPGTVTALLQAQRERPDDGTALALWSLAVHELWQEEFFSGRTTRTEAA